MGENKKDSSNLFICIFLVIFLLIIVTLPVYAGTTIQVPLTSSATSTPTIFVNYYTHAFQEVLSASAIYRETYPASPLLVTSASITITTLITGTVTPTATETTTATFTPTSTITPSETPTPNPTVLFYLPMLVHDLFNPTNTPTSTSSPTPTYTPSPTPQRPEKVVFCDNISQPIHIPDNDANGINSNISITDARLVAGMSLYLDISHTYVGDLEVTLTNGTTGDTITAMNRPGDPIGSCSNNNITAILDDAAAQPADDQCASAPRAISGIYLPSEDLNAFFGKNVSATWRLNVSDHFVNDDGWLNHWCLETSLAEAMPVPSPTPTPFSFPSSAYVYGMSGQDQQLNLDCESRSAVDWAKHFGFNIDEFDFLYNLPISDDPEAGFVGNPDGYWGYIPPNDYGVHALPVSMLLQEYGVTASSYHSLRWDDLRAEIAAGNPAIVWIIGGSSYSLANGIPHLYTAVSTGDTTVVAPYEHTVIIVGYSPTTVTILNGSRFIEVSIDQFLDSWSVLQFMAVLGRP
jgi:subtilisin-like proprotein convertase family protein/uncharacterized protein YvpB